MSYYFTRMLRDHAHDDEGGGGEPVTRDPDRVGLSETAPPLEPDDGGLLPAPAPIGVPRTSFDPQSGFPPTPFFTTTGTTDIPAWWKLLGENNPLGAQMVLSGALGDVPPVQFQTTQQIQYYDGWQTQAFNGITTERKAIIQLAMIDAGLLQDGDFFPGSWDAATRAAMFLVGDESNNRGTPWDETLAQLGREHQFRTLAGIELPTISRGRTYHAPDYNSLVQAAKSAVRESLGREINDWEIKLLADKMAGLDRQAFDAAGQGGGGGGAAANHMVEEFIAEQRRRILVQQEGDKQVAEARIGRGETGDAGELEDVSIRLALGEQPLLDPDDFSVTVGGGTVQDFDPQARFAEFFEEFFAGEIDFNQRRADVQRATSRLSSGLGGFRRMVG